MKSGAIAVYDYVFDMREHRAEAKRLKFDHDMKEEWGRMTNTLIKNETDGWIERKRSKKIKTMSESDSCSFFSLFSSSYSVNVTVVQSCMNGVEQWSERVRDSKREHREEKKKTMKKVQSYLFYVDANVMWLVWCEWKNIYISYVWSEREE